MTWNRRFQTVILAFLTASPVGAATQPTHLHYDSTAYVIRSGSGPRAIVFIPGLGSGGYEYVHFAQDLATRYTVYTVTFAGFDGEPAVPPPYLDRFQQSIVHLIADQKLANPVLVGEHFGGLIALRIAAQMPNRIGGVFVIDSVPASSPPPPSQSQAQFTAAESQTRSAYASMPKPKYDAEVTALSKTLVTDPKSAELVASHLMKDDPATFGGTILEYTSSDVRGTLPSITAPVEVLLAYSKSFPAGPFVRVVTSLYQGTPHLHVVAIGPSRHLVVYDQPVKFASALRHFLQSLPAAQRAEASERAVGLASS